MKKILKKIGLIAVIVTFIFTVMCQNVSAIGGEMSISFKNAAGDEIVSGGEIKVGDTLTVTVRVNGGNDKLSSASGTLTFNKSVLEFTGSSGNATANDSGVTFTANGIDTKLNISLKFKVIAEGSSSISVKSINIKGVNEETATIEGAGASVKAIKGDGNTAQDSASNKKAALTSITVPEGTLSPAFDSEILEYTVIVPYTCTDGVLSCQTLESTAKTTVEGSRELTVGNNVRTIVVVASNGETRRYTVTFNRLDENGNDVTVSGNVTDILVNVDGKDYNIAEQDATLEPPAGFTLSTATYGEKEVTAYKDASGKTVLLYMIEAGGENGAFFLYENGKVESFAYISVADFTYIVKDVTEEAPKGFYKSSYDLNGKSVACFKYEDGDLADFVVISAISPEGNVGYYSYDVKEKTVQRIVKFTGVASEKTDEFEINPANKTIVVALLAILAVLFILLIVVLILKVAKKKGKNIGSIFDSEDEYEMDESSDDPDED